MPADRLERLIHFHDTGKAPPLTFRPTTVFLKKEDDDHWYMVVAQCSEKDEFCRKIGRDVAKGRYAARPEKRIDLGTEYPKYEDIKARLAA